ncbi:MAG: 5'-nucleotidase C-terminal domain-containing protein [Corallococcus sp.]|nr:5'-nucleotidase C-terminal domain-containing protein [Corallococcus sp.]
MRLKHKFLLIFLSVALLASSLALASCDLSLIFHTHNFTGEWRSDNVQHWKKCDGCDKAGLKGTHEVSEWIVDSPSSATQAGVKHGNCEVCGRLVTEAIPTTGCEHDFSGAYESDDGGHFKRCSLCGETSATQSHTVSEWTQTKAPSETENGSEVGVCSVCNSSVTRIVPALSHTHVFASEWKGDVEKHWRECACGEKTDEGIHSKTWITDIAATSTMEGQKHEECSVCERVFATETIAKIPSGERSVDFYAINDFHGEVDKISTIGGFLKSRKNADANTVLINSGDMFQGSMESNSNYGKLLSDSMTQIGFDSFTFGNHEFDWGLNNLKNLANESSVPFLGANIYKWNANDKSWGGFADDLAQEYVVKTLDNGLKVGIIGVIGKDQITSISSNLVQTIGFKDPLPIIKTLSQKLRGEGCDLVVVSAHAGPQGLVGETENNAKPSSAGGLEEYVDAVFCAHTHREQVYVVDGLPFIQGGSYGSYVSHIKLSVKNGNVTCVKQENISYSYSWDNVAAIDTLIDNSNQKIETERTQVLATLSGSMNKNPDIARLVSRAIAEYAKNQGYDIALAMVNTARSSLSGGSLTYSQLYEAIPFDNEVFIAKVKGSDIINEVQYSNYYWRSSTEAIESDKYYLIAVIDYLLYHQNSNRDYNYFRSAFTSGYEPVALTKNGETYNYRMITRDYLLANSYVNVNDYKSDNNTNIDTSVLGQTVTLKYATSGTWSYLADNVVSGGSHDNSNTGADDKGDNTESSAMPSLRHEGTLSDPYTVSELIALAETLSSSDYANAYVKCKVSSVPTKQGTQSGDLGSFSVGDADASVWVYYVSRCYNASTDNNWSDTTDLSIGDELIIFVKKAYEYNGRIQIYSGYCVSLNGEATA